nr:DNA (cytosine-5-)-methyltransferase [Metamycoplasma orale]
MTDSKIKNQIIDLSKQLKINMVIGGPPCQGFSLKGKNLGMKDPRNFLFLEYYNIIKEIKPEIFIIENVKNLLNCLDGYFKNEIIEKFSDLGYIVNYKVLNAKNFGVPQNRERAIIIGSLSRSVELPLGYKKIVTVKDAISDLSYFNSGEGNFETEYLIKPQSDYQKERRKISEKLYNHVATNHSELALKKLKFIPPEGDKNSLPKELLGKQKFQTTWSRLQWNDISPTIDTRFDTPSNGRNSHPFLNRAITPREAARLQSFDDDFVFLGNKTSVCTQIGNSVPPLLAKAIAEQIKNSYEKNRNKREQYKIYNEDATILIKELIKNNIKVDHIITDPPYNISKQNGFSTLKKPRKGIDFGEWDKDFDTTGWIGDYSNILKSNGSMIIFCSYLYISYICDELQKNDLQVKDIIIWKKTNPMPRNVNRRYVQDTEFAVWAVKKNAKWIFNKKSDLPYLRSTFETAVVSGKEKNGHPTQKSLKLMEELINIHTKENEIILDPFMGSGTTGVAALKNKRKFIGIEIDNKYYEIAKERLKKYD